MTGQHQQPTTINIDLTDKGRYRIGDIIRVSEGKPLTITATSAGQRRYSLERGWEQSDDGTTWKPYEPPGGAPADQPGSPPT